MSNITEMPPQQPKYTCPSCDTANFQIEVITSMQELQYAALIPDPNPMILRKQEVRGTVPVLRVMTVCGACKTLVDVAWIPSSLQVLSGGPPV
jgi:hypothetical protein